MKILNYVKEISFYLLVVNLISFILMFYDKRRAIKGKYRISEKTLLGFALVGGSLGTLLGMSVFRHKTQKRVFKLGVPFIIVIQIILVYCFKRI